MIRQQLKNKLLIISVLAVVCFSGNCMNLPSQTAIFFTESDGTSNPKILADNEVKIIHSNPYTYKNSTYLGLNSMCEAIFPKDFKENFENIKTNVRDSIIHACFKNIE